MPVPVAFPPQRPRKTVFVRVADASLAPSEQAMVQALAQIGAPVSVASLRHTELAEYVMEAVRSIDEPSVILYLIAHLPVMGEPELSVFWC